MKALFSKATVALPVLLLMPGVAMAQTVTDIIQTIGGIVNDALIPLVLAIAVLVFFWGVVKYFLIAGGEEEKGEARRLIIWGLIGFLAMVALWGLVNILVETFNLKTGGAPPGVPTGPTI